MGAANGILFPQQRGRRRSSASTQIAPPMVHTKPDSNIQATLLGPPDLKIPSPNMDNFGDPLSKLMNDSGGPGGGSGIGSGNGYGDWERRRRRPRSRFGRGHGWRSVSSGRGRRRISDLRLLSRPEIFRRSPQGKIPGHGGAPGRHHAGRPRDRNSSRERSRPRARRKSGGSRETVALQAR